jgi:prepilin-type N-terminal cleavage/methylation domain-containing protein
MRRSGFTLVELLLVVAIIAVLAGLLIPIIGYARKAARTSKCEAQLGGIKAALELYRNANGTYPEKHANFATAFAKPGGGANDRYHLASEVTGADQWVAVAQGLLELLQSVDQGNYRDLASLRDPFTGGTATTNVFRYRPAKFYPLKAGATLQIDGENPPNPDTYQLWSAGLDTRDQYGERVDGRKSDDVANWKTP